MQKHCKVKAAYLKYLYETQYVSEWNIFINLLIYIFMEVHL